jgi:hypothetical protein
MISMRLKFKPHLPLLLLYRLPQLALHLPLPLGYLLFLNLVVQR